MTFGIVGFTAQITKVLVKRFWLCICNKTRHADKTIRCRYRNWRLVKSNLFNLEACRMQGYMMKIVGVYYINSYAIIQKALLLLEVLFHKSWKKFNWFVTTEAQSY